MRQAMTFTNSARERVAELLSRAPVGTVGLRFGIKARGCSGLAYHVEYASADKKFEEIIQLADGTRVLIDPPATMFLIGTEVDFERGELESKFVFRNPNEQGSCGCGESFTTDAAKMAIAKGEIEKVEGDSCG